MFLMMAVADTATIEMQSTVFQENEMIPQRYSGEGQNVSPPLSWSNLPPETKELALVIEDPDAPAGPFIHWVIYNIPPNLKRLPENVEKSPQPDEPEGVLQGKNSTGKIGYTGPMPPPGHGIHHYHFRLFALDKKLNLKSGLSRNDLMKQISDHIIAEGDLVGLYERK